MSFYGIQYRGLPADALATLEPQLLQACVAEADNPAHVPPGELKKVERLDEFGKVKFIDWVGQENFVKQMMRPGRRTTLSQMQRTADLMRRAAY
jgi:hypothetical protein